MKGKIMLTPFNHYFYLVIIHRKLMDKLRLGFIENGYFIDNEEGKLKYLDQNIPKELKKTGSLKYYEHAVIFYKSGGAGIRNTKTCNKTLAYKPTEKLLYHSLEDFAGEGKVYLIEYTKPFMKVLKSNLDEITMMLEAYSCFVNLRPLEKGFEFRLYAPLYKHLVIVDNIEQTYVLESEDKIDENTPEWVIMFINTLRMDSKEMTFEHPSEEKNLVYFRDTKKNKVVPTRMYLVT